jgi:hypothetical protein
MVRAWTVAAGILFAAAAVFALTVAFVLPPDREVDRVQIGPVPCKTLPGELHL